MKFVIFLLFSFIFLNGEDSVNSNIESKNIESKSLDSKRIESNDEKSRFLSGDINLLSKDAIFSVNNVSAPLFEKTNFKLFIHIIKEPSLENANFYGREISQNSNMESNIESKNTESNLQNLAKDSKENIESNPQNAIKDSTQITQSTTQDSKKNIESNTQDSIKQTKSRKEIIQDYEKEFTSHIRGEYAVIFLFFDDSYIDIKSNASFLDSKIIKNLLEDYAYPYLPAEKVGSEKYIDGVNEGLSNVYLATAHTIAGYYKVKLQAPKPMEKPSEATKVVIYIMLGILIVLFVLVSNGFLAKKDKNVTKK
ncbi:hypothetical protein DCO58_10530 [Helicobacter saguini]|uniref:Uncharacterized protein n=1 Tax=Helicobacter saguini TaxID=1548018 RepID=A0A347W5W3_9HELI|nr:hypothetical protein [Helicobacter saguini]MWV61265.1 hypothetical protein [Helicobacter saguini]MWV68068.1 hypothetical protein [Helicobacter saguini]MWV70469.1 hypothetical protein [Helicobacter saguini]MWV72370.1 hypothetical protein [Helicobacter saguini]TLD92335.1 hypothetical protein LS64_010445 [Helicobacter saguini]